MCSNAVEPSENFYEELQSRNIEQLDIEDCYDDVKRIQHTENALATATTHKLSKLDKSLITVVAMLSFILVASLALAILAYAEGVDVRHQLNFIKAELRKINIENMPTELEELDYTLNLDSILNYSSALEDQISKIQNQYLKTNGCLF